MYRCDQIVALEIALLVNIIEKSDAPYLAIKKIVAEDLPKWVHPTTSIYLDSAALSLNSKARCATLIARRAIVDDKPFTGRTLHVTRLLRNYLAAPLPVRLGLKWKSFVSKDVTRFSGDSYLE